MNTQGSKKPAAAPQGILSRRLRIVLSLIIVLHLAAVVAAPLAVQPSSYLAGMTWSCFRPYLEAAFLNHGYRFFGPDPGPSTLVRYEVELPDGTRREGVFPSRQDHRPRLLYHRHFMLSERLAGYTVASDENPQAEQPPWLNEFIRSYAEHLRSLHNARNVTLYLRRHRPAYPDEVESGMRLDDPSFYREELLIRLREERIRGPEGGS